MYGGRMRASPAGNRKCVIVKLITTRLPSNLRPTTSECVHLVTHINFRLRDKDGGHAIRSAIAENRILHAWE